MPAVPDVYPRRVEHQRIWVGRVAENHAHEHERFVAWLGQRDGRRMFRQYRLTGYELRQAGDQIGVIMRTNEPIAFIRFLRNPKAWPTFWEFQSASESDQPAGGDTRVSWSASAPELES